MAAKDRVETIKSLLLSEGQVKVSLLSQELSVTEETIRRDLEKLEAEGFLIRTHGGATLNSARKMADVHFFKRTQRNLSAKRAIARIAISVMERKQAIAADASSTVMEALRLVASRRDLTLLTNSAAVFQELHDPAVTIVSTGGEYDYSGSSFFGQGAKKSIEQYHVDLTLLSCKGVGIESGILDTRETDAEIKRAMIGQAREVALLVDHTKLDRTAFVRVAGLDRLTYLITDAEPSDAWKHACGEFGIKLLY